MPVEVETLDTYFLRFHPKCAQKTFTAHLFLPIRLLYSFNAVHQYQVALSLSIYQSKCYSFMS